MKNRALIVNLSALILFWHCIYFFSISLDIIEENDLNYSELFRPYFIISTTVLTSIVGLLIWKFSKHAPK